MIGAILAMLFVLGAFLPFYLSSSPTAGSVRFIRLNPSEFEVKKGKEGGVMYFVLNGDPKTLNPVVAQETTSTAVLDHLFTGLTKVDVKTMKPVPDLAERW
ncbi:MAG: ABC transporter substrate-binding protein, partial [Aquificaceae bacterium]